MKHPKAKKIFIHSNYHPSNNGGIESVVKSIINSIATEGYEIDCFFGDKSSSLIRINERLNYISGKIIIKIGGACLLSWGNFRFIYKSLKSDLIIFQEPYPTLWPALFFVRNILRKKVIVLVHANPVSTNVVMKTYNILRSLVFNGAICVSTSPGVLNKINCSTFLKTAVIPLTISNNLIPISKTLILPERYALYIGRLAQYKGIEYLLESAKLCKDVFFVIAGDGPLSSLVTNFILNNEISNIMFINRFVTDDEKYELIDRSEFLLFPSVSENEAFGLVQLEAMKSKKAIINTWLESGVNYVAPNEICAVTVAKKNSQELIKGIYLLWKNPDLASALGEKGFSRFDSLFNDSIFNKSWKTLVGEYIRH